MTYYHPVPAGFMGKKNCPRCRHFVTGIPFIAGLVAKGNEIAEAQMYVQKRIDEQLIKIEKVDSQIYDIEVKWKKTVPLDLKIKHKRLKNQLETDEVHKDMLSCDVLSVARLVLKIGQLFDQLQDQADDSNRKLPLVMNTHRISLSVDAVSHHRALAEVCENAEIFLSAHCDTALPRRSQALDKMLAQNNIAPGFFALSEEQQLAYGNQVTQLMLARLGGWGELNKVFDGLRPLDLISDETNVADLKPLSQEVKALLASAKQLEGDCDVSAG